MVQSTHGKKWSIKPKHAPTYSTIADVLTTTLHLCPSVDKRTALHVLATVYTPSVLCSSSFKRFCCDSGGHRDLFNRHIDIICQLSLGSIVQLPAFLAINIPLIQSGFLNGNTAQSLRNLK